MSDRWNEPKNCHSQMTSIWATERGCGRQCR